MFNNKFYQTILKIQIIIDKFKENNFILLNIDNYKKKLYF